MSTASAVEAGQYLTFRLENETFAIDISKVREVMDYTAVTKIPQTPDFMLGVINLRGNVVPVVDMRLKFGMTSTKTTVNTCIIIVEIGMEGENTVLGALADSVQEVLDLDPGQIEPPPRIGTRLKTQFIKGMGHNGNQFVIILDIDKVFSVEEIAIAQQVEVEMDMVAKGG
jgi:purine-binding chemotaxis protein CheW